MVTLSTSEHISSTEPAPAIEENQGRPFTTMPTADFQDMVDQIPGSGPRTVPVEAFKGVLDVIMQKSLWDRAVSLPTGVINAMRSLIGEPDNSAKSTSNVIPLPTENSGRDS